MAIDASDSNEDLLREGECPHPSCLKDVGHLGPHGVASTAEAERERDRVLERQVASDLGDYFECIERGRRLWLFGASCRDALEEVLRSNTENWLWAGEAEARAAALDGALRRVRPFVKRLIEATDAYAKEETLPDGKEAQELLFYINEEASNLSGLLPAALSGFSDYVAVPREMLRSAWMRLTLAHASQSRVDLPHASCEVCDFLDTLHRHALRRYVEDDER